MGDTNEKPKRQLYADREEQELFEWADRCVVKRAEKINIRRIKIAGITTIGSENSPLPEPLRSIADFFKRNE